jgi:DNA-binding HxlR family transcriptional regulator
MNEPHAFNQVFARRWAVPILARLADSGGCKFVTLSHDLGGSRSALMASLGLLDELGLVKPNSGLGHPMRPEYLLTSRGELVSHPSAALIHALKRASAIEVGLKKWSMPTIHAISAGADRFGNIVQSLGRATDRAVSLALNDMNNAALIGRVLRDGSPPHHVYTLSRSAKKLAPILVDIELAVGPKQNA